jgi:two-component system sensor histidine kinase CreC
MGTMIDGLLAAARFQNGQAAMVTVDLSGLVQQVSADHSANAASLGVLIEADPKPVSVQGDQLSLTRALTNLVENALRVAPSGSTLLMASGEIDGTAFLSVADQGPGFEHTAAGSGLGLSIVEQVAQLHAGRFVVNQRQAGGVEAVIWIPQGARSREV